MSQKEKLLFLGILALLAAVWLIFLPGCPFRNLTGIPCPGCGMSRAWWWALRLDFVSAFRSHPMFWAVTVAGCIFISSTEGGRFMYCRHCGHEIEEGAVYCTNCAAPVNETPVPRVGKNRIVVGLIALFLGSLGIHNFYLGYTNKGLTQLLVSVVGGIFSCGLATLAMEIWALIEAIQIFTGSIAADANGVPLRD